MRRDMWHPLLLRRVGETGTAEKMPYSSEQLSERRTSDVKWNSITQLLFSTDRRHNHSDRCHDRKDLNSTINFMLVTW